MRSPHEILDAVFYAVEGGCAWRLLPHYFSPWKTVYVAEAKVLRGDYREHHNHHRPHGAHSYMTPAEFAVAEQLESRRGLSS